MEKENQLVGVPDERIVNKIYVVRGQKVMFDKDLAELYGVETRVLNQAVKRNLKRFPEDFMFELNFEEYNSLRSQIVISSLEHGGQRYASFCFTEQGVTMLSCILNSDRAIQMNIQIIRIFTKLRQSAIDNFELRKEIEQIKKKVENQSKNIELVFQYLDEFMETKEPKPKPKSKIGFKIAKPRD